MLLSFKCLSVCVINKCLHLFQIFTKARAAAPAILFLDEVDAVVKKRSTDGSSGVEARILSTLLNEIDGVGISSDVYETTNRLALIIQTLLMTILNKIVLTSIIDNQLIFLGP